MPTLEEQVDAFSQGRLTYEELRDWIRDEWVPPPPHPRFTYEEILQRMWDEMSAGPDPLEPNDFGMVVVAWMSEHITREQLEELRGVARENSARRRGAGL